MACIKTGVKLIVKLEPPAGNVCRLTQPHTLYPHSHTVLAYLPVGDGHRTHPETSDSIFNGMENQVSDTSHPLTQTHGWQEKDLLALSTSAGETAL